MDVRTKQLIARGVFASAAVAAIGLSALTWKSTGITRSGPPQETNRQYHPNGFSLVMPEGWNSKTITVQDVWPYNEIVLRDFHDPPNGVISVRKLDRKPSDSELQDFRKTTFLGHSAHERFRSANAVGSLVRHGAVIEIEFPTARAWYLITLQAYRGDGRDVDYLRPFAETFLEVESP